MHLGIMRCWSLLLVRVYKRDGAREHRHTKKHAHGLQARVGVREAPQRRCAVVQHPELPVLGYFPALANLLWRPPRRAGFAGRHAR